MNKFVAYGRIMCVALLVVASSAHAEIRYQLDRTEIHANESFHLKVLVDNPETLRLGAGIDILPPELEVLNKQQFSNSFMVNGQFTSELGWDYHLIAPEAGTYTLPEIQMGKEHSKAITMRILPALAELDGDTNASVKLRAKISSEDVYVQQQIIFTVRLYRSVTTRQQTMPHIAVPNALVEIIGKDKKFVMRQGNTNYSVLERKYAIFPQQSGTLTIDPVMYSATIVDSSAKSDPWGLRTTKQISLETQPYVINVKPKPANADEPWLPATNLTLEGVWQPSNQEFVVGSPATLDFYIKGSGLLESQLPEVTFPNHPDLKVYRDSPKYVKRFNHFGVNSYHLEKVAIIPNKEGEITTPEISVSWWNVTTDQQEVATLPPMTIQVSAAPVEESNAPVITQSDTTHSASVEQTYSGLNTWQWLAIVFAVLWVITLTLYFMLYKKRGSQVQLIHSDEDIDDEVEVIEEQPQQNQTVAVRKAKTPVQSKLLQLLRTACNKNNASAAQKLIIAWANSQAHLPSVVSVVELAKYCDSEGLINALQELEAHIYNPSSDGSWNGDALLKELKNLPQKPKKSKADDQLPGLYS